MRKHKKYKNRHKGFSSSEQAYYLREGDFLPEPVTNLFSGACKDGLPPYWRRLLEDAGNIFNTREEAVYAGVCVRHLLHHLKRHKSDMIL
ncbi:hypothetical protein [Gabonia massiliensis]|uniref:hypothetical protein n=1 Tax=Gabonia massiliensis TaxID=1686296 RepID=UPI0006D7717A|nr:hypothetical protein [Gabonia massiliensis]